MTDVLIAIVCLVIGALLGYHFALEAILRFSGKQMPLDSTVRNAIRASKGKPQDAKFYPPMTDEEVAKEENELQARMKDLIQPGVNRKNDEQ
jgi:uncharacterized protein YneF (UPF0154 family)